MTVQEAINQFRLILHDISDEYDDYHVIMRLNSASQLTCALLVQIHSPLVMEEATFADGDALPANFLRTAGTYPVKRTGQTVEFLDGSEEMKIRYFVTKDKVSAATDEMPFAHDTVNDFIVRTACKLALNRNEFDISQDQGILSELQNAAAAAMG